MMLGSEAALINKKCVMEVLADELKMLRLY